METKFLLILANLQITLQAFLQHTRSEKNMTKERLSVLGSREVILPKYLFFERVMIQKDNTKKMLAFVLLLLMSSYSGYSQCSNTVNGATLDNATTDPFTYTGLPAGVSMTIENTTDNAVEVFSGLGYRVGTSAAQVDRNYKITFSQPITCVKLFFSYINNNNDVLSFPAGDREERLTSFATNAGTPTYIFTNLSSAGMANLWDLPTKTISASYGSAEATSASSLEISSTTAFTEITFTYDYNSTLGRNPFGLMLTQVDYGVAPPPASPGCITTNLKAWYKADAGIAVADGISVASWTDQSLSAFNVSQATVSAQPIYYKTTKDKLINFNPSLSFDGGDELKNLNRLYANTAAWSVIGIGVDQRGATAGGYRGYMGVGVDGNYPALDFQNDVISPNGWNPWMSGSVPAEWSGGSAILAPYSASNKTPNIAALTSANALLGSNNIISYVNGFKETTTLDSYQTNGVNQIGNGLFVGSSGDAQFIGLIPEILVYDRQLTDTEMQKVQSYLATKYGTTIDQDYLAGDGTTKMWDKAANATYHNNVFGIAKDDCQSLLQKQSKSQNEGFQPVISTTGFNATNTDNAVSFLTDKTFLFSGSDAASATYGTAFAFNGMNNRITRIWKVQETGTLGSVKVALAKTDVAGNVTQLNLLRSTDVSFDGSDTMIPMTIESIGGVDYYTATIDFNNNDFFTFGAYLVTPGCVAANLTAWYKSESGVTGTTAVTRWADQVNGYDVIQATAGQEPSLQTADKASNYYPYLKFDGVNDHLEYKLSRFMSTTSSGSVFGAGSNEIDGGGYENFADLGIDNPHMGILNNTLMMWMNGSILPGPQVDHTIKITADQNEVYGWNWTGGTNGGGQLRLNGNAQDFSGMDFTAVGNGGTTDGMFTIGGWEAVEIWKGKIYEVVLYDRNLTATEKQRVDTYLAIKYGSTLAANYLSGDGTTIYAADGSGATTYDSRIFGIGRDDCQGLVQKQSNSTIDGFLTISNGALAASNAANTSTFSADKSFEMIGDNGLTKDYAVLYSPTSFTPAGAFYRMNRIWKVDETGTIGTVRITVPAGSDRLLVSNSDAFGAGTQELTLTADGNGNFYADVDLTDGQYFTFGRAIIAPGCVGANLTAWYKAEVGVTGTTAVTRWADQVNGYDVIQATAGQEPSLQAADKLSNYNPYLKFDGINDHLEYKLSRFMSTSSSGSVFGAGSNEIDNGGYENFADLGIDNPHMGVLNNTLMMWMNGSILPGPQVDHAVKITANQNQVYGWNWTGGTNGGGQLRLDGNAQDFAGMDFTAVGNGGTTDGMFTIGGWEAVEIWKGKIYEVVLYDRNLTATEKQRVDTYLAIKYGSTLAANYLSGDGTTIYAADGSGAGTYDSRIFGIGRDDCQGLNQKQSNSTIDGFVTVSNGALAASNAANTSTFTADKSFEMIGDNGLTTDYGVAYSPTTFTPAGAFFRMNRVWKVDETGTVGTVRITATSGMDKILVSSSDTFGAGTQELALTADGNGNLYADIDFADGQYFTFGRALVAPGCVSNGLSLWLKSDDSGTSVGSNATAWKDNSPLANDVEVVGTMPLMAPNAAHNYNPYFGGFSSTNFFKDMSSSLAPQGAFTASEVTMIAAVRPSGTGTGRIMGIDNDDNFSSEPDLSLNAGHPAYYRYWISAQNVVATGLTVTPNQSSIVSARTNGTQARLGLNGSFFNGAITAGSGLWGDILTVGYGTWANPGAFPGDIQEVIWYKSSLSDTEVQKIQSYLAIKYGSTLAFNYLDGSGATIYDVSTFGNNIAGIGRDDCQALSQKQSTSSSSGIVTMGIDSQIATSNAANTGAFNANSTFLVWGDNNATGTVGFPTTVGACPPPPSSDKRLNRVWKVTETGAVEISKVQFDATGFGFNTNYPVFMLVSSSSTFASYTSIPMSNGGTGNTYAVNYDFAAGDQYITFSGNTTPLANVCSGNKTLNWLSFAPFDWWSWGTRNKTYSIGDQQLKVSITDSGSPALMYIAQWYPVNLGNYLYVPRYDNQPNTKITTKIQLLDATGASAKPAQAVDFKIKDIDGWVWGKDVVNVYGKLGGAIVQPKLSTNKYTAITLNSATQASGSIWPWDWTVLGDLYVNFNSPIDEIYVEYTKDNTLFPTWKKFNDIAIGNINITCRTPMPEVITPDNVYLYKEVSPQTGRANEAFTYKFTLQNLNCDAKTINLNDVLPAGLTWVDSTLATSLTVGTTNAYGNTATLNLGNITLPAGTSYIYAEAKSANAGTFNNQATFTVNGNTYQSDEPSIAGSANPTPITILAATKPNLVVTKAADKTTIGQNQVVKYSFTLKNNEATAITTYFEDALDKAATYVASSLTSFTGAAATTTPQVSTYAGEGAITIRDITIPANGTVTFSIDANVNATAYGDTVRNSAKLTPNPDPLFLQTIAKSNTVETVLVQTDNDGDGVGDALDLDDDNDGILDTDENNCGNAVYTMDPAATVYTGFGTDGGYFDLKYNLLSGTAVPSIGSSFMVRVNYSDFTNNFGADNKWEGATGLTTYAGIKPNVTTLFTGLPTTNTTTENASGSSFDIAFNGLITSSAIQKLGTFNINIGALPSAAGYEVTNQSINIFSDQNAASSANWLSGYYARPQGQTALNPVNASTTLPFAASHGQTYIYDYAAFSSTAPTGVANAGRGLIAVNSGTVTFSKICDTDNDGIVNSRDLDSDGDGCSDAFEAGATTNTATNFAFANSTVGANGLSSLVENNDTQTATTTYTSTYSDATNNTIKGCTDTDGDGVADAVDLDDDNDGILDTVECFTQPAALSSTWTGSGNNWSSGFSPTTINATFSGLTSIAGQTMDRTGFSNTAVNTAPDIFFIYTTGSGTGNITFTFNKPVKNPILHIAGVGGIAGTNLSSLITLGGGLTWTELSQSSAAYVSDGTTLYKNLADAGLDASGSMQINGTVSTVTLTITTQPGSAIGADGVRVTMEVPTAYSICSDTDNDGINDYLDLDSDGDGIADNIEAQATGSYVAPASTVGSGGLPSNYNQTTGLVPVNTDVLDNPDYLDTDSDNAQGNDTVESGVTLAGADADHDGLDDGVDTNPAAFGPANSNGTANIPTGGLLAAYPNNGTQVLWRSAVIPALPNITAPAGTVYNDNGVGGGIANDCVQNGTETANTLPTNTFYVNLVQGSAVVKSSPIAADGSYSLTAVADGTYQLIITNSATATSVVMPTGWALVSGTGSVSVQVTSGTITPSTAPKFCLKQVVDITGTPGAVFNDNGGVGGIAGNCIKDGNEGTLTIPTGMFINLVQGAVIIKSSPVAADGSYSLTGVGNGSYQAVLTSNPTSTTPLIPAGWAMSTGTGSVPVTITNGALVGTAPSFCMRQVANISAPAGTVYVDNGIGGGTAFNCVKDGTEGATPIPANTFWINLVQGSAVVKSSVIATDGSYTLSGVVDGTYNVVITTSPTSPTTAMPTNWELSSGTGSASITVTNGVVSPATPTAFCLKNCVFTLPTLNK